MIHRVLLMLSCSIHTDLACDWHDSATSEVRLRVGSLRCEYRCGDWNGVRIEPGCHSAGYDSPEDENGHPERIWSFARSVSRNFRRHAHAVLHHDAPKNDISGAD